MCGVITVKIFRARERANSPPVPVRRLPETIRPLHVSAPGGGAAGGPNAVETMPIEVGQSEGSRRLAQTKFLETRGLGPRTGRLHNMETVIAPRAASQSCKAVFFSPQTLPIFCFGNRLLHLILYVSAGKVINDFANSTN